MLSPALTASFTARAFPAAIIAHDPPYPRRPLPCRRPELVPLDELRPTQAAVGMRSVAAKREKVEDRAHRRKKIMRFLEKRPIPAVLGPDQAFYIIDHHHLGLALWQSNIDEAFVQVVDDLSGLGRQPFWTEMARSGRARLVDETGQRIRPSQLPPRLHRLKSDTYRDLAWSVREEGGFEKSPAPFAEFRWADFFRNRIPASRVRRDYEASLDDALRLARSRAARDLPGYLGRWT